MPVVLQVVAVQLEVGVWKAATSEAGAAGLPGVALVAAGEMGAVPSAVAVGECGAPLLRVAPRQAGEPLFSVGHYSPRPALLGAVAPPVVATATLS